MDEKYAPISVLKKSIGENLPHLSYKIRQTVFEIFDSTGIGIIPEDQYMSIMYSLIVTNRRTLAAFQATDVKGKGVLGYNSMKTLFWLMNAKEPTDKKVAQEIDVMPFVNSEISVHDWIKYLVCTKVKGVIIESRIKEDFDLVRVGRNE
eukprot:TRINITY_DN10898_c0_g1_i6.p3 TRINITY_DN10898_c0_g1~~TRINITY_DN10898_c0_g1_i6.p3  ORF type:complete len:149 (+),score=37.65 TRINITY_DN10898_c0_g1_i6:826-1272(+)